MFKNPKQTGKNNLSHIQLLSQKIETKKKEEQEAWKKIQNIEKEIRKSEKNGKETRDRLIEIFLHELQLLEILDDESRIEDLKNIKEKVQQIEKEIQDLSVELASAEKDREVCLNILKELGEVIPQQWYEESLQKKSTSFLSVLLRLDSNAQSSLLFLALLVISIVSVIHITVIGVKKENISVAGAGVGGITILWRMKILNDLERNKEIRDYEMLLKTFMSFLEKFDKMNILKDNNQGAEKIINAALLVIKNLDSNLSNRYSGNSSNSDIEDSYVMRIDDDDIGKPK
jgi:hypothetical protein